MHETFTIHKKVNSMLSVLQEKVKPHRYCYFHRHLLIHIETIFSKSRENGPQYFIKSIHRNTNIPIYLY